MLAGSLDGEDFRRALKMLKDSDPELAKQLRKDLRSDVKSYAQQVISAQPPLSRIPSGFLHGYSATRYEAPKATVSFTPGMTRRRRGWTNLVSIGVGPKGNPRGYAILELAGTRSSGKSEQGQYLVAILKARFPNSNNVAGRFFWQKFYSMKPQIVSDATASVQKFIDAFNREI